MPSKGTQSIPIRKVSNQGLKIPFSFRNVNHRLCLLGLGPTASPSTSGFGAFFAFALAFALALAAASRAAWGARLRVPPLSHGTALGKMGLATPAIGFCNMYVIFDGNWGFD